MATINFARREIEAKIVYCGPALSGKTTNVRVLHELVPPAQRGHLHTLATDQERTLFFDYVPLLLGQVSGFKARFKLFTVPGQAFYRETRRVVLAGADGVVLVADSTPERAQQNLDALLDLEEHLTAHGSSVRSLPFVLQFNKRDVEGASDLAAMHAELNPHDAPEIEAVARASQGVLDTLYTVTGLVVRQIREALAGRESPVRLVTIERPEAEDDQRLVDETLARVAAVRPVEEARSERMRRAARIRPDDLDADLLEEDTSAAPQPDIPDEARLVPEAVPAPEAAPHLHDLETDEVPFEEAPPMPTREETSEHGALIEEPGSPGGPAAALSPGEVVGDPTTWPADPEWEASEAADEGRVAPPFTPAAPPRAPITEGNEGDELADELEEDAPAATPGDHGDRLGTDLLDESVPPQEASLALASEATVGEQDAPGDPAETSGGDAEAAVGTVVDAVEAANGAAVDEAAGEAAAADEAPGEEPPAEPAVGEPAIGEPPVGEPAVGDDAGDAAEGDAGEAAVAMAPAADGDAGGGTAGESAVGDPASDDDPGDAGAAPPAGQGTPEPEASAANPGDDAGEGAVADAAAGHDAEPDAVAARAEPEAEPEAEAEAEAEAGAGADPAAGDEAPPGATTADAGVPEAAAPATDDLAGEDLADDQRRDAEAPATAAASAPGPEAAETSLAAAPADPAEVDTLPPASSERPAAAEAPADPAADQAPSDPDDALADLPDSAVAGPPDPSNLDLRPQDSFTDEEMGPDPGEWTPPNPLPPLTRPDPVDEAAIPPSAAPPSDERTPVAPLAREAERVATDTRPLHLPIGRPIDARLGLDALGGGRVVELRSLVGREDGAQGVEVVLEREGALVRHTVWMLQEEPAPPAPPWLRPATFGIVGLALGAVLGLLVGMVAFG